MSAVTREVVAAGAVVFAPRRHVLLVHRPKYDDWSFPKGKLDRFESAPAAAVREVEEETGLRIRLGPPLSDQEYPVRERTKRVHYWVGRTIGDDDVERYVPNDEIDQVAWVPLSDAVHQLTYEYDRVTLAEALGLRRRTRAVVVLRHAAARSRSRWSGEDAERPVLAQGARDARRLVPLLSAYAPERIISSPSARCLATVQPLADSSGVRVETEPRLAEGGENPDAVAWALHEALADQRDVVLCSHRPVLPAVFSALRLKSVSLAPGEFVVVHERQGDVVSWERHRL